MKLSDYLNSPNILFLLFFSLGIITWVMAYFIANRLDKYESKKRRKKRIKQLKEEKEIFNEFN